MDRFEHYKETYHRENQKTKDLYDGLNIPIGIITVLATAVAYYLANFDYLGNKSLTIIELL